MPSEIRPAAIALLLLLFAAAPSRVAFAQSYGTADDWQSPASQPSYAGIYDDPYRRPFDGSYRYQPPAEVARWGGLYVGAHLGGGTGSSNVSGANASDFSLSGFEGGVLAGYNFQIGSLVAGAETDIAWTGIDGSEIRNGTALSLGYDWLSSFRIRLGYAFDNWLVYGTGGFAYSSVNLEALSKSKTLDDAETLSGYVVGAGAEYALTDSIRLRGEALYYDFGESQFFSSGSHVGAEPDVLTFRAGVTLRFD